MLTPPNTIWTTNAKAHHRTRVDQKPLSKEMQTVSTSQDVFMSSDSDTALNTVVEDLWENESHENFESRHLRHILSWKKRFALAKDVKSYRKFLFAQFLRNSAHTHQPYSNPKDLSQLTEKRLINDSAIHHICKLRLDNLRREALAIAKRKEKKNGLTAEEKQRVLELLRSPKFSTQVLIKKFNISITQSMLKCLEPFEWCNDEIINFYLNLLQERNQRHLHHNAQSLKFFIWSTFFYTKLMSEDSYGHEAYDYNNVQRWTLRRKVDIFSYDLLLIPIHIKQIHWALSVVDFRNKTIAFLDSLSGPYSTLISQNIFRYICDEHQDKKNQPLPNMKNWRINDPTYLMPVPQQTNGSDCGVFVCLFCECLTDNRPLDFCQEDIPERRFRMVLEICSGKVD